MKLHLTPEQDLQITAETGHEIAEICKHFNLDITKHTDDLIAGTMIYVAKGDQRLWFAQSQVVDFKFLQPYYDLLKKITGYAGPGFYVEDERLRYPGGYAKNLCHTHIVDKAWIDTDGYYAEGFIQSRDWNGQTAEVRAPRLFNEYLRSALGFTKNEPEYVEVGNGGLLRRNPNYMKHHAPEPKATSSLLFEVIFEHWLEHHANEAQRQAWAEGDKTYRSVCNDSLAASMLHSYSSAFHIDNYKSSITFDQFKAMGQPKEQ